MTLDLVPPADAALPLIRTSRSDLWRYASSNEHGAQMRDAVALLEVAIAAPEELVEEGVRPPTLAELYTIVHKALASALKVIARADDSAEIIGDVCRDLNARASPTEAKRSGNAGANFSALNHDSEYGLSSDTRGRERDRVTSRSDSSAATVLEVMDVPRSACTTCGVPWIAKISVIISTARGLDSAACTCAPTM